MPRQRWTSRLRRWFFNTSIGRRLAFGFACLLALIALLGAVALHQMRQLEAQNDLLVDHPFAVTRAVDQVEIKVLEIHREMKDLAHERDGAKIRSHLARVEEYERSALEALGTVRERFLGDPLQVAAVYHALRDWRPIRAEVVRLRLAGEFDEADAVTRGTGAAHVAHIENVIAELQAFAAGVAAESHARGEAELHGAYVTTALILLAAILLGGVIAVAITRSIRAPLADLDRAARAVSSGDLGHRVEIRSEDELGRLGETFNAMVQSIAEKTEEIRQKNEENERLLLNILPGPIAERLKQGEEPIADYFPEVSVLFADIVGFSPMSTRLPPAEIVAMLDRLFTAFDESAQRLGIEKIKTIGDAYMAVAGLTHALDDHVSRMVEMALEMRAAVERVNREQGSAFEIRIGVNCGPVVAGVIGKAKFIYDLWGDTVNLASRMESHGLEGRIQITEDVERRIRGRFPVEERGLIEVKGRGRMRTFLVVA